MRSASAFFLFNVFFLGDLVGSCVCGSTSISSLDESVVVLLVVVEDIFLIARTLGLRRGN